MFLQPLTTRTAHWLLANGWPDVSGLLWGEVDGFYEIGVPMRLNNMANMRLQGSNMLRLYRPALIQTIPERGVEYAEYVLYR